MGDRHRGERLTLDLGMQPHRDQIIGGASICCGLGQLVLGHLAEAAHELHVRVHELHERVAVALAHVDAHQPLAPALDLVPHGLGVAEQAGGEPGRQLAGDRVDQLALAIGDDGVEQLGHECVDLGPPIGHFGTSELVLHEHALLTVSGIVLSDHVDLVGRPDRAVALSADEHAAAALDLHDVGVAGDAPQAVAPISIHRFVGPHPRPRVVRVRAVELGVEQIHHETAVRGCDRRRC